ncbi:unnamed protein product [Aphis gossypii]|uniref:MD-2-related lipid-recognition domain-containing protein n=1 Tax=Aphis gossypii TaxID=80765 RepID=A0A9P0IVU4_APHGO|nr:unnamed protein product [Aphis gossypii]
MAGKDSIGGWKDNAMVFQKLKACSSLKQFLGAVWTQIMDSVGIYNATCPIPMGFYKLSGLDTAVFASANFSKKYFYGSYKFRFSFTKNNEVYGCFVIVVELRRPWETD